MVSIKDVAKQAGVAISTVSKVLNNYPNVSEETKKKVNEAVDA
ncbi:MAG: LacI family DNA-binding transcriptional regulator, partial [Lachnospiraceae bacterium]|nr:LacI family DNA-binding transcriptional regulator [Lachnospiraceae bacterium]